MRKVVRQVGIKVGIQKVVQRRKDLQMVVALLWPH
jgi:hypothetical protein